MRLPGLDAREETAAARLAAAPLVPLAWAWGAGVRLHRALHRRGLLRATRLACRVVCVGSLLVGGSGKTPAAAWLAAGLARRGRGVAIASRGHGGWRGADPVVVSDGRRVHAAGAAVGDEAHLLAAHAPGVPVLVARERAQAGLRALALFGAEILVVDDGFQHHRLRRDLDLVLLDAGIGLGNGWVLPRGPLREPVEAVRWAHAVGVVDGELRPAEEEALARFAPGAFRFRARRRPVGLRGLEGGPAQGPGWLRGRSVGLLAGIARPASLRRTLESLGARVVAERRFRDHHRYRPADLAGLAREAALWVTSEKDAPKIHPAWVGPADVRVLAIELEVADEPAVLDWIEARLR